MMLNDLMNQYNQFDPKTKSKFIFNQNQANNNEVRTNPRKTQGKSNKNHKEQTLVQTIKELKQQQQQLQTKVHIKKKKWVEKDIEQINKLGIIEQENNQLGEFESIQTNKLNLIESQQTDKINKNESLQAGKLQNQVTIKISKPQEEPFYKNEKTKQKISFSNTSLKSRDKIQQENNNDELIPKKLNNENLKFVKIQKVDLDCVIDKKISDDLTLDSRINQLKQKNNNKDSNSSLDSVKNLDLQLESVKEVSIKNGKEIQLYSSDDFEEPEQKESLQLEVEQEQKEQQQEVQQGNWFIEQSIELESGSDSDSNDADPISNSNSRNNHPLPPSQHKNSNNTELQNNAQASRQSNITISSKQKMSNNNNLTQKIYQNQELSQHNSTTKDQSLPPSTNINTHNNSKILKNSFIRQKQDSKETDYWYLQQIIKEKDTNWLYNQETIVNCQQIEEVCLQNLFGLRMSGIFRAERESLKNIFEQEVFMMNFNANQNVKNYDHIITKIQHIENKGIFFIMRDIKVNVSRQMRLFMNACSKNHAQGRYSGRLFVYDNNGKIKVFMGEIPPTNQRHNAAHNFNSLKITELYVKDKRQNPALCVLEKDSMQSVLLVIGGYWLTAIGKPKVKASNEILVFELNTCQFFQQDPVLVIQMNSERMTPMFFKQALEDRKYLFILGGNPLSYYSQQKSVHTNEICELLDIDRLFSMITRKQYKIQKMHTSEVLNIRDYQSSKLNNHVATIYDGFVYKIKSDDKQKQQIMLVLQDGIYNVIFIDLKPFLVIINKVMHKVHVGPICNQMAKVQAQELYFFQDGPGDSYTKLTHQMDHSSQSINISNALTVQTYKPQKKKHFCAIF